MRYEVRGVPHSARSAVLYAGARAMRGPWYARYRIMRGPRSGSQGPAAPTSLLPAASNRAPNQQSSSLRPHPCRERDRYAGPRTKRGTRYAGSRTQRGTRYAGYHTERGTRSAKTNMCAVRGTRYTTPEPGNLVQGLQDEIRGFRRHTETDHFSISATAPWSTMMPRAPGSAPRGHSACPSWLKLSEKPAHADKN